MLIQQYTQYSHYLHIRGQQDRQDIKRIVRTSDTSSSLWGPCQTAAGWLLLWLILSRNPLTSQWSSIVHSHMIWLPLFLITINSTEKKFLWPWLLCGISNPTIQTWLPRNFNIFCSSNPRLLPTETRPDNIENPYKMLPPEESGDM